jgi:ABC-type amino acid transport substrate-binding protein
MRFLQRMLVSLALAAAVLPAAADPPAQAPAAARGGPPGATAPMPEFAPRTVRVAVFPDAPFAMREASGRWDGFAAVLLQAAATPAHLVLEFHECASLDELFAEVGAGKADIGIGNTLVTSARLERVDFTQPILEGGLQVMVPSDHSHTLSALWDGLVDDGHVRIVAWGALITVALSVVVVLVLRRVDPEFTPHLHEGFAESFYHVVSVTMTGKTTYKGKLAPGWVGRIVAALWLVFGVASVAYLTSSLTSVMTANTMNARINGPRDLRGKTVGTLKGSVGERYCALHGLDVVPFPSVDAAAAALAARQCDAVVADAQSLEYFDTSHPEVAVATVGELFERRHYAFAVRSGDDDLLRRLNIAIVSLREDGAIDRVRGRWFGH